MEITTWSPPPNSPLATPVPSIRFDSVVLAIVTRLNVLGHLGAGGRKGGLVILKFVAKLMGLTLKLTNDI